MAKTMKQIAALSLLMTLLFSIIYHRTNISWTLSLAITFGTTFYHFFMRFFVGLIVNKIMHNHADYNKKWYQLRSFEKRFYKKINVKGWKNKMPTYSPDTFSMKNHTLSEIAQAMCQAEIVHEIIVVFSFIPLLIVPVFGAFGVFLITSLLAAGFDLMFVMMQRYNRPRIVELIIRLNHSKSS